MAGNANSGRRPRAEEALMMGRSRAESVPDLLVKTEASLWRSDGYRALPESAKPAFRKTAKDLMQLQLLSPLDVEGLARWAYWRDKVTQYSKMLDKAPLDNDLMRQLTEAEKMMLKYASVNGLSIYDRQKLRIKPATKQVVNNKGVMNIISNGRNPDAIDEQ